MTGALQLFFLKKKTEWNILSYTVYMKFFSFPQNFFLQKIERLERVAMHATVSGAHEKNK